ncbi:BQ2448_7193 [Microbotryum intermedium]|uniref:BQ2448_7193 protein n=1 Tax=Microbotryum intermedium TaxID=269621 RepID=A0A238FJ43_9BASI|nr:BQ2448_7193 [Microbotryum intermedium]
MATSTIDEFDRLVRHALTKSLSQSRVQAVVDSAMLNLHPDITLVASMLRHHRKATPPRKLPSLYLVDAIAREARKRAKRALKELSVSSSEPSTSTLASTTPDYASFMNELEGMLTKIVLDSWENGEQQHRVRHTVPGHIASEYDRLIPSLAFVNSQEKVRKILEIWQKGGVFSSPSLSRINTKITALDQQSASGGNGSAALSTSTTPPPTPPPGSDTHTAPEEPTSAPSGLPASVLALFGGQYDSTSTSSNISTTTKGQSKNALSIQDEVARAIAGAKSGVFLPNEPTCPSPPPPSSSISAPPGPSTTSTLPLKPSQFALVESLAKPASTTEPWSSSISYPALHSIDIPEARNELSLGSSLNTSSTWAPDRPSFYAPPPTGNASVVAPAPPPPPPGFKPPNFLPTPQLVPSSTSTSKHAPAPASAPALPSQPQPQPPPFDPTTFSALSPQSWSSLITFLRPTLFSHLKDRDPTMGEVMAFVQMMMVRQQQQQQMLAAAVMNGNGGGTAFVDGTDANGYGYASQTPMTMAMSIGVPSQSLPQPQTSYDTSSSIG